MSLHLTKSLVVVWFLYISSGHTDTSKDSSEATIPTTMLTTTVEEYEEEEQEAPPPKKSKEFFTTNVLLFTIAGALVVSGCLVSFSLWMLSRRARARMAEEEGEAASPQKMDSEAINLSEFQEKGPLVMQARMKGRIKHALDDDKSFSLKEVQFYPQYNEICIIGSDVEQLEGMSQLSMLSGEKSAELAKGARKGAYPTMAGEVKRREAEAAAREAQRVRENERRIAESAMRRRARDAAAVAAPETPSDKGRHETTSPEMHSQKSTPRKSMALERTQHSQKSVSKRSRSRRHDVIQKTSASPSQQSYTQVDDHRKAHAPVVMRKKPSNDGRHPDALGVRSYKASLSRSSKNVMEDSRSQKTSSTDSEARSGRLAPRAASHNQQDSYSEKRSPHH